MKIRVLIVDDSEVYRLFLRTLLASEPNIEVLSTASNGRLALPRVNYYKPEIILLDYDMPEMDGLEAIPEFKRLSPKSRIIMFSSHTSKGARLTLKALQLGADDFITKPTEALVGGVATTLRDQILERIHAFMQAETHAEAHNLESTPPTDHGKKIRHCVLGISTGGPAALRRLFTAIPKTIQGSIFVVQHMPPLFTAQLAESLNADSQLKIIEAKNGLIPEPGTVYIAPGGKQMKLRSNEKGIMNILIEESDPNELCKPSANILFHSIDEICPSETLAVIMTGMGDDGYQALKALASHGAYLMAQKAEDCVIFGMPAKPVRDGIVHESHNVEGLARRITELMS